MSAAEFSQVATRALALASCALAAVAFGGWLLFDRSRRRLSGAAQERYVPLALEVTERTRDIMEQIGAWTGVPARHRLARVVQDAVRTYEWVLYHQAHGRTITALHADDLAAAAGQAQGTRAALAHFILPGCEEQVRATIDGHEDAG